MRKINLWLASILAMLMLSFNSMAQGINSGSPTIPFGSNTDYKFGILPSNLPSGGTYGIAQDAADAYLAWKDTYVKSCNDGRYRVAFDEVNNTVSEGIAYGMVLSVYAADKAVFDGLWQYYKDFSNVNGVMDWKISGCSSVIQGGGATDAELDAAHALIIASEQWPGDYDSYIADAATLIKAIRQKEMAADGQTLNGDLWGSTNTCRNPSYQSPAYYTEYAKVDEAAYESFWATTAVSAASDLLLANRNSTSGLVSNWCDTGGSENSCGNTGSGAAGYGADACRNPWRMATDYLWHGDAACAAAKDINAKLINFINGYEGQLKGPITNRSVSNPSAGSYINGSYATYALAAMTDASAQSSLNKCYTNIANMADIDVYFNSTIRCLTLFVLTGNFWGPGTANIAFPPKVTSAVTNADGDQIILTLSKDLKASSPSGSSFTLSLNGTVKSNAVSSVSINGTQVTLNIESGSMPQPGQTISLTYDGTGGITSTQDKELAAFSDYAVLNMLAGNETILDDCEDGNELNNVGGIWFTFNDGADQDGACTPGTKSKIEPLSSEEKPFTMASGGYGGSDYAVMAEYTLGTNYTPYADGSCASWENPSYVGIGTWVDDVETNTMDWTGGLGVSFMYNGPATTFQVIIEEVTDYAFHFYAVPATNGEWKEIQVLWADLAQPSWTGNPKDFTAEHVQKLQWQFATDVSDLTGKFYIDDVRILGMPPVELTALTIGVKDDSKIQDALNIDAETTDTLLLEVITTPDNATYPASFWSSSNEDVVTVDYQGRVFVQGTGEATITARSKMHQAVSATFTVKVPAAPINPETITFTPDTYEIGINETTTLYPTFYSSKGDVNQTDVTWETSDPTIATVDAYGTVKGIAVGDVTITAISDADNTVKGEASVSVKPIAVTAIEVDITEVTLTLGESKDVVATVIPAEATNQTVIWESSDETVAKVSDGTISSQGVGTATITVYSDEDNTIKAEVSVTVSGTPVESVSLDETSKTILIGEDFLLTATVLPGSATQTVEWSSSDETIASVEGGTVKGLAEGEAVITVVSTEDDTKFATCTVTVNPVLVETITLNKSTADLFIGDELEIKVLSIEPTTATLQTISWESDDETVAKVDANGLISAIGEGEATITAKADDASGVTATVVVNVSPVLPTSVSTSEAIGFKVGDASQTLEATVLPEETTNKNVTWSSDDEAVAKVDPATGEVTPVGVGECNITVTCEADNTITAVCKVTVSDKLEPVTGVELDKTTLEMGVGTTYDKLVATVAPAEATNKSVTWKSDDEAVATVSNGIVKAITAGTAKITVTTVDGDFTAECTVTVSDIKVEKITLSETALALFTNSSNVEITATVEPEGASTVLDWTSTDETVVTVTDGLIKVIGVGTATVTAEATDESGVKASIAVTVSPVEVTGVTLDPTTATLSVNGTKKLTATVEPADATNQNVTWESSDETVATVDENGLVTAKAKGDATITVKTEDGSKTATCEVTVNDILTPVEGVAVKPTSVSIALNETANLTPVFTPSYASNQNVSWSSDDESVVKVDADGKLSPVGTGTATVTVKTEDGDFTADCTVEVTDILTTSISITNSIILGIDESKSIVATIAPEGASEVLSWESDDETVATVDQNGKVTAKGPGEANITATSTDGTDIVSNECVVKVATIGVTGVSLNETSLILDITDAAVQLTADVQPEDAFNKNVTWSSSTSTVASVTDGEVKPLKVGTTNIKVITEDGGYSAKCVVEVVDQSELSGLIDDATALRNSATEGTEVGEYEAGSKATFLTAINAAKAVLNSGTATQSNLDDAVDALETAMAEFNKAKIVDGTLIFNAEMGNMTYLATYWFSFNDADPGGASTVSPLSSNDAPFSMSATGYESDSAAMIEFTLDKGTLTYDPFVGMGMPLLPDDAAGNKQPYDLTGSTGISFTYKADAAFSIDLSLTSITDDCNFTYAVPAAADWTTIDLTWDDFAQPSWGTQVVWDPELVTQLQWKVQTTDGTAGQLWVDDVTIKGIVLDLPSLVQKDALVSAIEDATALHNGATEGTGNGEYAIGSKAVLMDAIEAAQAVADDADADQGEVDAAIETLANAVTVFVNGINGEVDKSELEKAILIAEVTKDMAEIGTAVGQYTEAAASDLADAIADAQAIVDNANATPGMVSNAVDAIEAAVTAFKASKLGLGTESVRESLAETIAKAQKTFEELDPKASNSSKYTDSVKNAFYASIQEALEVFNNGAATKEEIKAADDVLFDATTDFNLAYQMTGIVDAETVGFKVSPIPAISTITVECSEEIVSVKITSISGALVLESDSETINVDALAKGYYFVTATLKNGSTVSTKITK